MSCEGWPPSWRFPFPRRAGPARTLSFSAVSPSFYLFAGKCAPKFVQNAQFHPPFEFFSVDKIFLRVFTSEEEVQRFEIAWIISSYIPEIAPWTAKWTKKARFHCRCRPWAHFGGSGALWSRTGSKSTSGKLLRIRKKRPLLDSFLEMNSRAKSVKSPFQTLTFLDCGSRVKGRNTHFPKCTTRASESVPVGEFRRSEKTRWWSILAGVRKTHFDAGADLHKLAHADLHFEVFHQVENVLVQFDVLGKNVLVFEQVLEVLTLTERKVARSHLLQSRLFDLPV